jgi:hypothetical protein
MISGDFVLGQGLQTSLNWTEGTQQNSSTHSALLNIHHFYL